MNYTIVGGMNGTGKSSLTGVLKAERNDLGHIIDADILAYEEHGNLLKGAKKAVSKIKFCLTNNISFTQETTLSGHMIKRTIKQARCRGYQIRLYYVGLNTVEECIRRVKNRVRKGGHDVPENIIRERFQTRFISLSKILPFCDEAKFYDNENKFVLTAEYRNGELLFLGNYQPKWLLQFENYLKVIK